MWTTYKGEGTTLGLTPVLLGGGQLTELGYLIDERSHSQPVTAQGDSCGPLTPPIAQTHPK